MENTIKQIIVETNKGLRALSDELSTPILDEKSGYIPQKDYDKMLNYLYKETENALNKKVQNRIKEINTQYSNMKLDEAIFHLDEIIPTMSSISECGCKAEHEQLRKWLLELKELRSKDINDSEPENYKDRFIKEYRDLCKKRNRLNIILHKYKNDELDFNPNCSYDLLHKQLIYMDLYKGVLEERAYEENIKL